MRTGALPFLCVALLGALVIVIAYARSRRVAPDIDEFLVGLDLGESDDLLATPFLRRATTMVSAATFRRFERLLPGQHLENLRLQLAQAGLTGKRSPGEQLARQAGLALAGTVAVALALPMALPPTLKFTLFVLPVMGFVLPSARLKKKTRARSDAIFKDLPDIVDMLAIAVEAGSGFEGALTLVCRHFPSPLTEELNIALHAMELGMPRRQALQELKQRAELEVVRSLVVSLLQADALGIPIGRVLKAQAAEVRARRRAWAREKAAKLPVKILFPLVLFIFPPLLALVLGPAAFSFSHFG